jgi:hypothetical protein
MTIFTIFSDRAREAENPLVFRLKVARAITHQGRNVVLLNAENCARYLIKSDGRPRS